jgi:hypothetical protein
VSVRKGPGTFSGGQWWVPERGGPPRTHRASAADPKAAACGALATTYPIYIAEAEKDVSCKRCLNLRGEKP